MLLTAWLMIAICMPLAVRFRRSGAGGPIFMIGLAIGFTYSIFEGISLTMGERHDHTMDRRLDLVDRLFGGGRGHRLPRRDRAVAGDLTRPYEVARQ